MRLEMRIIARSLYLACFAVCVTGCVTDTSLVNRRYLLDPTMDPAKTTPLGQSVLIETYSKFDVSAQAGQSTLSGACPTCGG